MEAGIGSIAHFPFDSMGARPMLLYQTHLHAQIIAASLGPHCEPSPWFGPLQRGMTALILRHPCVRTCAPANEWI